MSKINRKKLIKISFCFIIIIVLSIVILQSIMADNTKVRYFLTYDSYSKSFKDEITEHINDYKYKTHYEVHFKGKKVTEMLHHFFLHDQYTITYYRGIDTPLKEISYKNLDDVSKIELVNSIQEKYQLLSSFLHSIKHYRDGLVSRTELYRNGEMVAYKERDYIYRYHTILPYKEEHWEKTSGKIINQKKTIENSLGEEQLVYDGEGFQLKTVWIYYDKDYQLYGYYYYAEDYDNGQLQYYHSIFYYEDMRGRLDTIYNSLKYGEISKKEYEQERMNILKDGNSSLISRIDDYKISGKYLTRRFYSRISTLIEIWYYDNNNINRLVEYYNPDGSIRGIDIKDSNGYLVESYNETEVSQTFFLSKRKEILDEENDEENEEND